LALAATGATYGIRGGIPFLIGILLGLFAAILGTIIGLGALFAAFPNARIVVQACGGLYIFFIAIKIATAPVTPSNAIQPHRARKLMDGFIINLLNPKAYAAFLAIFSQFLLPVNDHLQALALTGAVCLSVATVVDILWLCFGGIIGPIFKKPRQARILRVTFAVLMIMAVLWAFSN
jgi:threonine/homoserine/homoserine lactone efflux protein